MKKYLLIAGLFAIGCATVKNNQTTPAAPPPQSNLIVDGKLFTAVWMQRAAEYKALCEQAYNIATFRLNRFYQQDTSAKPLAVITDIDETLLDNSPYAVHQALQGKDFDNASWNEWVSKATADTIPGALAFFRFAASKGISVFYVTNRDAAARGATLQNLQKFGFPYADEQHLVTMDKMASKEERRQQIAKRYTIVMLLGDNLSDFSALFDKKTEAERTKNVLENRELFGKRFIILPNPNYGDWESAMYQYRSLTANQKDSVFKFEARNY